MSAKEFLSECLGNIYKPRETRPISEWAYESVIFEGAENRMFAGTPYDVRLTPYNNAIFEFLQDPEDRELIILKSSQIGLTLAVYIGNKWLNKFRPGNALYVARDVSSVRELGKQRFWPLMEQGTEGDVKEVSDKDQTIQVKKINGVTIRLVGAQSASGFISFPCSYAFLDESETHADLVEGSTIALTRARFKGDSEYKMVVFSKAQDEAIYETDKVTKKAKLVSGQGTRTCDEFYSGTQETYHVPCPHCDHYQPLTWDQMKLDPAAITSAPGVLPVEYDQALVEELTYQECVSCHGRILDKHKRKIVPLGRWTPAAPDQRKGPYKQAYPRRRSLQMSDLFVFLFDSVHWGKLMLKWLEAQGDDEKLDAFYNDHLGLPRPERKSAGKVEMSAVDKLISTNPDHLRLRLYDEGRRWQGPQKKLHFDPLFLGIGIDKQKDHLKLVIGAFEESGELHILDYAAIFSEADLTFLLENFRVDTPTAGIYPLHAALMDCGHIWASVMDYAFEVNQMGIINYFAPARGVGDPRGHGVIWPYNDTSVPHRPVQVVNFNNQYWENELFRHRIIEARLDKPSLRHPRIHLPQDVDEDFKRELTNGQQTMKKLRGKNFEQLWWEKARPNEANDFADCIEELLIIWDLHKPQAVPDDPPPESEEPPD